MRRVCEAYCQALLDVLADRSMKLGAALGLDPEHASGMCAGCSPGILPPRALRLCWPPPHACAPALVAVFTEAEVRASVVFQLSKLTSLLLKVGVTSAAAACHAWLSEFQPRDKRRPTRVPLPPHPQATTSVAGGSPWDVVVAGDATGMLLAVDCLEPGCLDAAAGKVRPPLRGTQTSKPAVVTRPPRPLCSPA